MCSKKIKGRINELHVYDQECSVPSCSAYHICLKEHNGGQPTGEREESQKTACAWTLETVKAWCKSLKRRRPVRWKGRRKQPPNAPFSRLSQAYAVHHSSTAFTRSSLELKIFNLEAPYLRLRTVDRQNEAG